MLRLRLLISIACLLVPAFAPAAQIAPSLGIGHGYLENGGGRTEICPGGITTTYTDGSYENGYTWQYGGVAPHYTGAFAQHLYGTGSVCAAIFDFSRFSTQAGGTMDVYLVG